MVRPHCYLSLLSHRSIAAFIYVISIPVTTSLGLCQCSLNSTDQQILSRGWKPEVSPYCQAFLVTVHTKNEQAWVVIQNNASFQRYIRCVDCITTTGDDTIIKHSSSVVYVFAKSCFQLEDVTLPLKHIHSSHHTKTFLWRCLHAQVQNKCHVSSHGPAKWGGYTVCPPSVPAYEGEEYFAFLWDFPSEACFPDTSSF